MGGTIDDSELVKGLVFNRGFDKASSGSGPSTIENAKIGVIQFCLSAPKTDMEVGYRCCTILKGFRIIL